MGVVGDTVFSLIIVAIIFSLVRPGSKASGAVVNFGDAFSGLLTAAVAA